MRILVTDGMDASAVAKLRADGFEVVEQFYEPDELGAALREFDVVIIRSATKIKEPQIDAAKGGKLKVIIRAGVGVDNIAVKYAEENGFVVKNTPRASSNAVAELAIALRRTEPGQAAEYCRRWLTYLEERSAVAAEIPLYSDAYVDFHISALQEYGNPHKRR